MRNLIRAGATLAVLVTGLALAGPASAATQIDEDWSSCATGTWAQGSAHTCADSWKVLFNGGGTVKIIGGGTHYLEQQPQAATSPSQTYSALTATASSISEPTLVHNEYQTNTQLRTGSSPNPWEVGWTLFDLNKDSNGIFTFYYILLKPNGWEIGKDWDNNGVQAQTFLATGSSYTYPVGDWLEAEATSFNYGTPGSVSFTVRAKDANGDNTWHDLATVTDSSNPFTSGQVGVYCEDSQVQDGYVNVTN